MEQVIADARKAVPRHEEGTLDGWQQGGKWFKYEGHAIFSRMNGQGEPWFCCTAFPPPVGTGAGSGPC